jgi:hypothetical protein
VTSTNLKVSTMLLIHSLVKLNILK